MTKKEFINRLDRIEIAARGGYIVLSECNELMLQAVKYYTQGDYAGTTLQAYHAMYVRLARLTQGK